MKIDPPLREREQSPDLNEELEAFGFGLGLDLSKIKK